jgi:hypothetical protein
VLGGQATLFVVAAGAQKPRRQLLAGDAAQAVALDLHGGGIVDGDRLHVAVGVVFVVDIVFETGAARDALAGRVVVVRDTEVFAVFADQTAFAVMVALDADVGRFKGGQPSGRVAGKGFTPRSPELYQYPPPIPIPPPQDRGPRLAG